MGPDAALGTITVRDASGIVVHDGRIDDAAPLGRFRRRRRRDRARAARSNGARMSREPCAARRCAPRRPHSSIPRNYLDKAPGVAFGGEDNADFVDRNDAAGRAGNGNGFIRGPVRLADGATRGERPHRRARLRGPDAARHAARGARDRALRAPARLASRPGRSRGAARALVPPVRSRGCAGVGRRTVGPLRARARRRARGVRARIARDPELVARLAAPRLLRARCAAGRCGARCRGSPARLRDPRGGSAAGLASPFGRRPARRRAVAGRSAPRARTPECRSRGSPVRVRTAAPPCAPGECDRVVVAPRAADRNDVVVVSP